MNIKYRLHEVAKDLNVDKKEIVSLLEKHFNETKKHMTALNDKELDIVFEHFTQANQVSDLNEYFNQKKEAREEKQVVEVKPQKAVKPVKETFNKPKPVENKPAVKPQSRQNAPKAPQKPIAQKPQANNNVQKSAVKPSVKHVIDKSRFEAAKNASVNATNKPVKPMHKSAPKPTNQPIMHSKMEETTRQYEENVRHVDTKTVEVNLDKYNERYEQIAPARKYENSTRKQKINQKSAQRNKARFSNKRETEAEKLQKLALQKARKQQLTVFIPPEITVSELASRLKVNVSEVIKKLMLLGVMASQNQIIDYDTGTLVAEELGAKVEKEVVVTIEERLFVEEEDTDDMLEDRGPIVVVMGHVDHGKTSILDKIRNADVTSGEAGGITQHIGSYMVNINGKNITFLDTPGHEAFTAMRARGALATDIAILVVAADDGIMPQTVEAINHAKAAGIEIIVAINKMDKPTANPDRVKQELTEYELVPEEWGGNIVCCPVSAHTGEGMEQLLDMVQLTADMLELKANPNRLAKGTVIESRLDVGKGPLATMLVQNGTLKIGDVIIAGTTVGRVRAMLNDKGEEIETAGPCVPVEISGLAEVPTAGDDFAAVGNERLARELVEQRKHQVKEENFSQYQKVTLDNLFSQIAQGEVKELPIVVKGDVNGSVEAVRQSLEKLSNEEVRVKVIHGGVGAINRSDVMLAQASGAIVIGFNVRPDNTARELSESGDVEIRLYRIIYDAIDDVKQAMKGLLDPKQREVELGRAQVRQVYRITNIGTIAGCYVTDGKVVRSALIRVVRDGIVIAEDKIDSLKRFKEDAKEVAQGY